MSDWPLTLTDRLRLGLYRLAVIRSKTLPRVLVWDLHTVCNQNCSYCAASAERKDTFGPIAEPAYIEKFRRFFDHRGPFNVVLTGGEPLISPQIEGLIGYLVSGGHLVSLQTNLSLGPKPITRRLPRTRTGWILASLHSCALPSLPAFLKTLRSLSRKGYPLVAKVLLDQAMLGRLDAVYPRLRDTGAGVYLCPVFTRRPDQSWRPQNISPGQINHLAPMVHMKSTWLLMEGGFRPKGISCRAGSKSFYARAWNGEIAGCGRSYSRHLGDIYQDRFQPLSEPVTCGLEQCACDFNIYCDLIEGLSESAELAALARGEAPTVPYGLYRAWLQEAGLEACWPLDGAASLALQ